MKIPAIDVTNVNPHNKVVNDNPNAYILSLCLNPSTKSASISNVNDFNVPKIHSIIPKKLIEPYASIYPSA